MSHCSAVMTAKDSVNDSETDADAVALDHALTNPASRPVATVPFASAVSPRGQSVAEHVANAGSVCVCVPANVVQVAVVMVPAANGIAIRTVRTSRIIEPLQTFPCHQGCTTYPASACLVQLEHSAFRCAVSFYSTMRVRYSRISQPSPDHLCRSL